MTALAAFQREFAAAVLGSDAGDAAVRALAAQPGFAVYRNTVATACIEALAANYPTVRQIVGDEWFDAAALVYARRAPPADARLAVYGAGFADFLAGFEPAAELPYLAAVARFDRLWSEAHVAADASPLAPASLAALDPEAFAALRLAPHPAARWAWSADVPAFEIWRRHREGTALDAPFDWTGDGGLVVRPLDAVAWLPLDADGIAFLDACAAGRPFADAAEALGERVGDVLPVLIGAGAFREIGDIGELGEIGQIEEARP